MSSTNTHTSTLPPDRDPDLRRFEIKRCLGTGGYGEVYLASMTSSGGVSIDVALKVLHQGRAADSQAVRRLRDEGRLLGMLNHPAILQIHDLVLFEDRIALVTEYVPGADLDRAMHAPEKPLPLRAALEVLARIAEALDAAHHAVTPDGQPLGLVHRDIKPSNIRLGPHGDVKLLDFGIAKSTSTDREARTETNQVIGSFLYLAPERFDDREDSPASDVFGLGCTLFEVLAGTRLFEGLSPREQYVLALSRERYEAWIDEHTANLRADPEAVALCRRLVSYDPAERPTAAELVTLCEDLADRTPGSSLRGWAREHDWRDDDVPAHGLLDGRVISESRSSGGVLLEAGGRPARMASLTDSTVFDRKPAAVLPAQSMPRWGVVGAAVALLFAVSAVGLYALVSREPTTDGSLALDAVEERPPVVVPKPDAPDPVPDQVPPVVGPVPPPPAAVQPAPEPAKPPALANVTLTGDALDLRLVNSEGRKLRVGPVPAGTYTLLPTFPPPIGEREAGELVLGAGQAVTVECKSGFFGCKVFGP